MIDHQDTYWATRAQRGDKRAFGLLIDKYQTQITALLARSVAPADQPDLRQEIFLQAWLNLARLRQPDRFGAWLYGIARNLIHMYYRRQNRPAQLAWDDLTDHHIYRHRLTTTSTEAIVLARASYAELWAAIETLPPTQCDALQRYCLDGLSYQQIATELDISLSAVKSRIHKARQQLRQLFKPATPAKEQPAMTIEATVHEVYTLTRQNGAEHAVAVLKARDQQRYLPIWIGPFEGSAIKLMLGGHKLPRPLTYDLMATLLETGNIQVQSVQVSALREEVYYGTIQAEVNGETTPIDCRPSDGLALALRVNAPIFIDAQVLEQTGIDAPDNISVRHESTDNPVTHIAPLELPEPMAKRIEKP